MVKNIKLTKETRSTPFRRSSPCFPFAGVIMKNEYTLLNGSPIEMSLESFKLMIKSKQFKIPKFQNILEFDNQSRFLADVICTYATNEFAMITVNYGSSYDILKNRDTYHELYSLFLHKNYPLILNNRILLSTGKVDLILTKADCENSGYCLNSHTRFSAEYPEQNLDTRPVHIIRSEEIKKFVKILNQKDHHLGEISAPHISKFSEDEVDILRNENFIDSGYSMFEAWDVDDDEKALAAQFQEKYEKSGGEVYKNPTYANLGISGKITVYDLEIDCSRLNITDPQKTILFENIFNDNICLKRDFPMYLEDQSDYWVESSVMTALAQKEFDISTSLLLSKIEPDRDGQIRLKVINKLINDVRTDHGW